MPHVSVINHRNDKTITADGDDQECVQQLMWNFPWLRTKHLLDPTPSSLSDILEELNASQAYEATTEEEELAHAGPAGGSGLAKTESTRGNLHGSGIDSDSQIVHDMLGATHSVNSAFGAARFLVGGNELSANQVRHSMWTHDGNVEKAALHAYGLEPSEGNLKALRAVHQLQLKKFIPGPEGHVQVLAATPDGDETKEMVQRAYNENGAEPIRLNGKHSTGAMLARDQHTQTMTLLKPGTNDVGPAAGSNEQPGSQSEREAAFYQVAEAWGLGDFVPKTHLLLVDGREYAAIYLLPWSYQTLDKRQKEDPNYPRRLLERYMKDGTLHKWAVLDYVLGNPDRHGQNIMSGDGGEIALIDHGACFAGPDFNPAYDNNSFIPFYLRAWGPQNFRSITPKERLRYMPRVSADVDEMLKGWLQALDGNRLGSIAHRYGIDVSSCQGRLAAIKAAVEGGEPVDSAVNRMWAGA